jgi:hypothetical protein
MLRTTHLILLYLIALIIFGEEFFHPFLTSCISNANIIHSTSFSNILNLYNSFRVKNQVLHHMKGHRKYIMFQTKVAGEWLAILLRSQEVPG